MKIEVLQSEFENSEIVVQTPAKVSEEQLYPWHIHNAVEFLHCIEGDMNIYLPNEEYHISSGDIILINSRVPHKTFTKKDTVFFVLHSELYCKSNSALSSVLIQYSSSNLTAYIFNKGTPLEKELNECFDKIIKEKMNCKNSYEIFIKSFVINIHAILYRNNILRNPYDDFNIKNIEKILPVINYVNENYSNNLPLAHISKLMNFDKHYFCKIFKSATSLTFVQYLNLVRLNKAAELLQSTSKTISEIAVETGFTTSTYLIRNFKTHFGCTPAFYRKIKLN